MPSVRKQIPCQSLSFFKNLDRGVPLLNPATWSRRNTRDINTVPNEDQWRLPLLQNLLYQHREMDTYGEDVKTITELIDSLCTF
jgi:hypothetical protein